jgi:FKBP-type peptidyl-prolyl cis-trans isomerase 2
MKVTTGHNVSVHYKGTLTDGTEFDNSRVRGQTLDFQVGSGRMIRGFNDALLGMVVGDTKKVTLLPEDAYGERDPEAIQPVPKEAFGPDFEFEIGGTVQGNGPRGPFLAKIQALDEEKVLLDMNHPLAGEELSFEIELVGNQGGTDTETEADWSSSMKKAELLEVAHARGLKVNTRTTKAQIIEALESE